MRLWQPKSSLFHLLIDKIERLLYFLLIHLSQRNKHLNSPQSIDEYDRAFFGRHPVLPGNFAVPIHEYVWQIGFLCTATKFSFDSAFHEQPSEKWQTRNIEYWKDFQSVSILFVEKMKPVLASIYALLITA